MPSRGPAFPVTSSPRKSRQFALLAGVSVVALTLVAPNAVAGSLRDRAASPAAAAAAVSQASAQAAAAAASQAITRVNQSLRAMRDAQAAARAAAQTAAASVPNGLVAGGLVVAPGATQSATNFGGGLWQGADLPAQRALTNGRSQVEIKQTDQKAILTWQSFNVGRETDLYFNQTAGGANASNWIALNRVIDPGASPSRILGTIKAEGQVYIINANGIIFGGASQVNVGALVASSLSLSNAQLQAGINNQLLIFNDLSGSSIAAPQFGYLGQQKPNKFVGVNDPAQTPAISIGAPGGDVVVEAGASITAAAGGKAMLFAPRVRNAGSITAPDGQVIMAAGEQVYLLADQSGVRGLDVAVSAPMPWVFDYFDMATAAGQIGGSLNAFQTDLRNIVFPAMAARAASVGYTVVNTGVVEAERGNITLMGREIVQAGGAFASTALNNRDGSIRLRAWDQGMIVYGAGEGSSLRSWSTGTLVLGPDSQTAVMPDMTDTGTVEGTSEGTRYRAGRVELRGKLIDIEARASVVVPSGSISVVASTSPLSGEVPISTEPVVRDGSRIYIGEDAVLSVAGLQDILLTMDSNVVQGELRINELRDSVLYRDSWLRGKTVTIDRRRKGRFASGPMAGIEWIKGDPGAWVGTPLADLSAWIAADLRTLGYLSAKGGTIAIKSSGALITRPGSVLDVTGGSIRYGGGAVNTTKLLGADGRVYDIGDASPDRVYVGFAGETEVRHARWGITEVYTNRLRQGSERYEPGYTEGRDAGAIKMFAAEGVVLEGSYRGGAIIGERQAASGQGPMAGTLQFGEGSDPARSWLIGDLVLTNEPVLLPKQFGATTPLDSSWYWGGPAIVDSFRRRRTEIDTDVLASAGFGTITLYVSTGFTLGAGQSLELAPKTTFEVIANTGATTPANEFHIDGTIRSAGGTVRLAGKLGATGRIDVSGEWVNDFATTTLSQVPALNGGTIVFGGDFADGAVLDVSGGAQFTNLGGKPSLKRGEGGKLALQSVSSEDLVGLDMRGYAAGSGASLELGASGSVQIGGVAPSDPSVLHVSPTLYGELGFRSVTILAGDVVVPDGVMVSLVPAGIDLSAANLTGFASGTPLAGIGRIRVPDIQTRIGQKPAALAISASGSVTIGAGARVGVDVGGQVVVTATAANAGRFSLLGTIDAPAGLVNVDARLVTLGSTARVTATGVDLTYEDAAGLRTGTVLGGGSVSFKGAMTLTAGSVIDVSGTSGTIDIGGGRSSTPTTFYSDGGSISLTAGGAGRSVVDATLRGFAGGPGASGGTLSFTDTVTASGSKQNATALGNFIGYFFKPTSYPAGQPRYNYDPATGTYSAAANGDYIIVGNLFASFADLDIYGEIPASRGAIKLSTAAKTAIDNLLNATVGNTRIVTGLAADAPPEDGLPPSAVNAGITADIAYLLDKHYYVMTRTGSNPNFVYTPIAKINVDNLTPYSLTIGQASIGNGGFSDVGINAPTGLKLGDGVRLDLPASRVSITTPQILAPAAGANAEVRAAYLALGGFAKSVANTAPAAGVLTFSASLIDVSNALTRGYAETRLVADNVRLRGVTAQPNVAVTAQLNVDGTLAISAAQVYPDSQTAGTITAAGRIVVTQNAVAGVPPSAGGALTLTAPQIEVNGTLRAPFGSVKLAATGGVTLGEHAVISVSGNGLTLPYGTLFDGDNWGAAPPEKKVILDAPSITLIAGSKIDISGGGDLHAAEYVPGPGGSHDILAMPEVYAVVPSAAQAVAPTGLALGLPPLQTTAQAAMPVGKMVWLAGGGGLAPGWYTLMPARYALLPGAFAVQMVTGSEGNAIERSMILTDGTMLMAGRAGDLYRGTASQQSSTWRVMSGGVVRKYTEYTEVTANAFFASDAFKLSQYRLTGIEPVTPRLPTDGGSLVLKATDKLILDGQVQSQAAAGGRGGLVDIAAAKIAVVGRGRDTRSLEADHYLILDADRLSALGASSLLIGGTRSGTSQGMGVTVAAGSILVDNGATVAGGQQVAASALAGPEIILAATGTVDIAAGSVITARGDIAGGAGNLIMTQAEASKDYGAVIRVSNGDAVAVVRTNVDSAASRGLVRIGAGAQVDGGRSLTVDTTGDTTLAGSARLSGDDIVLGASRIGIGGGSGGLVFTEATLARFAAARNLTLKSYSTVDIFASVNVGAAGLRSLTLDAAALVARTGGPVAIIGDTLVLRNSAGTFTEPGVTDQASLSLEANTLVLGGGTKALRGFTTVRLAGSDRIVGDGVGRLDAGAADLALVTPLITGRGGSQAIATTGRLTGAAPNGSSAAMRDADSLGSRWTLTARSIDMATRIDALGGTVAMTAVGGDVVLADGARIDVGGATKTFFDVAGFADAGTVVLTAVSAGVDGSGRPIGGNVTVRSGATLDLAAAPGGGDAGTLSLVASGGGGVALDGAIVAHAGAGRGGTFGLDIAGLSDFAALGRRLDAAGFTGARSFRVRSGDVTIDGTTAVQDFSLTADTGKVTIAGDIVAAKAYGGSIAVTGGNGVTMVAGSRLAATSTTELGGGRVTLDAGEGRLDVQGGTIDVGGGEGGRVRFRAWQVAGADHVAVDRLAATITGARSAVLEGVKVYTSATTSAVQAAAQSDADAFVVNAGAIASRLNLVGIDVASGIEIRSSGDLTVDQDWNLATRTGHLGTLTLRAAGNLNVNGNISDGFTSADRTGTLLAQESWNLRLVAGADLASADALVVTPAAALPASTGSVVVGTASTGKVVRTGTGDIDIRAGRDVRLAHYESVVYTAGRKDLTVYSDFTTAPASVAYGIFGGNLRIAAQGGVSSTLPADRANMQLYTEWLKRQGALNASFAFGSAQSSWWVDYGSFKQGVGALGGGNVAVSAGGDVENLLVALPTNARVRGGRTDSERKLLELRNGGAMTVEAAGAVKAGFFYVGRGEGTIRAGEFSIGRQVIGLVNNIQTVFPIAPVLSLGDATMRVTTAGDLRLQTVLDPLGVGPSTTMDAAFMSGQTGRTALSLTSIGGDVVLVNQGQFLSKDFATNATNISENAANLYPSMLRVTALNGAVSNLGVMYTLPGSQPELRVLAEENVVPGTIVMSRAMPEMMPSPLMPIGGSAAPIQFPLFYLFKDILLNIIDLPASNLNQWPLLAYHYSLRNPDHLPNENDHEPSRIYTRSGSILGSTPALSFGMSPRVNTFVASEQTWFRAGRDIRNVTMDLRNVNRTDTTWFDAGNDVIRADLMVQGPGSVVLTASRDIYQPRIATLANRRFDGNNRPMLGTEIKALPWDGASIELLAGLNGQSPAYAAFAATYLDPANVASLPAYLTTTAGGRIVPLYLVDDYDAARKGKQTRFGLVSFVADVTGRTLAPTEAWAAFRTLPANVQERFIRQVYIQELRAAGRDHNDGGATGGYERGYAAIETLFPGGDWKGSVVSPTVYLRTMSGGDIVVLAPGGGFQLASRQTAVPSGDGVVTLGYGDIGLFARDSIAVNRSRVLTFAGGDETLWSTHGDIDAGRGAKTTRVPSSPEVLTDADAVTRVREKADMSGSGIGTIIGFTGVEPGDVDLIAPEGTVNAGDAGIRVSGNLSLAARFVLNIDNIQVAGEVKGIKKAEVTLTPLSVETKDKAAADAVRDVTQQATPSERPSVIIVEILGYGGGDGAGPDGQDDDRRNRRSGRDSYDPSSAIHMLGNGRLTEEQARRLTEDERRRLNSLVVQSEAP